MLQTDLYSFSYKKGSLLPTCKRCGAENFYRDGKNKTGMQRYKCKKCNYRFLWTSDLPRRNHFSNVISFATELYTTTGISLRTLAKKMYKFFKVKVSYEGIRQWVLASKKTISRRKIVFASNWHVDETYIKIRGRGFWLWIVFCADTKQVLAWHISKKRLFKEAKKVLSDALKVAGIRPEKIITDGLYQYTAAIKKVMGWHWRVYRRKHVIDSGIGKNAIIERLNREIKRRVKWFSTFQNLKCAKVFFSLWFYHHNTQYLT